MCGVCVCPGRHLNLLREISEYTGPGMGECGGVVKRQSSRSRLRHGEGASEQGREGDRGRGLGK